jgi:molybdopterin-guanine dinucleotide biosynthesis protein
VWRRQDLEIRREAASPGKERADPVVFPGSDYPPEIFKSSVKGMSYKGLQLRNSGLIFPAIKEPVVPIQGWRMRLVLIGGHSRNIGKTSVVEGLIRSLPEFPWTAVKITQYGHGVCAVNGESCGCAVSEHQFAIVKEREVTTGTDTSRFLAAGARRSLWVRTKQGELFTALPAFEKEIQNEPYVIVESNSLRRFLKPDVYLQVLDPRQEDFKLTAQQFFDLADAYLLVSDPSDPTGFDAARVPWQNVSLSRQIRKRTPCFPVTADERFLSSAVVDFVRAKIEGAD